LPLHCHHFLLSQPVKPFLFNIDVMENNYLILKLKITIK